MAFAVLRLSKLKSVGNIGGLSAHIERTMHCPNADKSLQHLNQKIIGTGDLVADVQSRMTEAGVKPQKDSVLAVEFLMTASPDHFDGRTRKIAVEHFVRNSRGWLQQNFGLKNLVEMTLHMDESTPHIHAVIVPIVEKMVKVGRTVKREVLQNRLCAADFFDGREKLSKLQTSFAEEQNLWRGIKGSKAHHTTVKEFYSTIQEGSSKVEEKKEFEWPRFELKDPNIFNAINPRDYAISEIKRFKDALTPLIEELVESNEKMREIAKEGVKSGVLEVMKIRKDEKRSQTDENLEKLKSFLRGKGMGTEYNEGKIQLFSIKLRELEEEERRKKAAEAKELKKAEEQKAREISFVAQTIKNQAAANEKANQPESCLSESEIKALKNSDWARYNSHIGELRTSNNLLLTSKNKINEALQILQSKKIRISVKGPSLS